MYLNNMYLHFIVLIIELYLLFVESSLNNKRKKIVVNGDLMIGALIPVHEQPSHDENRPNLKRKCGVIRDQYGVQRVEALLYMLDKINNKKLTKELPGIKLGLEIRDECWETSIALEETIDFIKDTIATDLDHNYNDLDNIEENYNNNSKCVFKDKNNQNRILAVIGPGGSSVAINVQNLLQLFDIPQIGYSATSRDLSDKKLFKTFLRVVPSDYLQVRAMIDLVVKMNWTFVFAIYTDGSYGQAGMEAFRNETSYLNICLALYEKIREYASDEDYDSLIIKMDKTKTAKVIVCFCYGETIRGLLAAINRLNLKGRFIILGSDGWSDRIDVAKDYYEEALGSFSLKAYSPVVKEFDEYFINLNPSNNLRNVWFNEYWQERFNCYIDEEFKKKFKNPCKRKCPLDFIEIGANCYWFSNENITWNDADLECRNKNFNSKLIDLNQTEIENILYYIESRNLTQYLNRFHVRIEIDPPIEISSSYLKNNNEEYTGIEQTTKYINCNHNNTGDYDQITGFGDDNLFTYFNSKINQSLKCISILISKSNNSNNYSYCIETKSCFNKYPFICKIKKDESQSYSEYYPDSLKNYQQDPKMSYVMNSLLAIVNGLNQAHQTLCGNISGLCDRMKKINGSELLINIKNISFSGTTGENIYFDVNGDPPGRYVVLNVQKEFNLTSNSTKYVYKEVGNWDNEKRLTLDLNRVKFLNDKKNFKSVCSEQCKFGHVKQIKQGGSKCCWNCKKCEDYTYVLDEHTCQECELGYWPNKNLTGCQKLPLTYLKWNHPASIFALLISCIGIILNTVAIQIFIKFSNTCVVKSTTKELSFIILAGVYLCYLITIPIILKPSKITCFLTRILPGFSLSVIYGALLTKTNRIARILARSKKKILTKKPRFMSLTSQIVITLLIIIFECCLIVAAFIKEPKVTIVNYIKRNEAKLECFNSTLSILGPLGYNMFLIALCTLYAIRTRNLPENFNEAKFIGFSMYTTCVIWIAFIPLYFGSDFKVITLSLSISFSATVILIFLFLPKCYIILFEPEKNQRSAFATSKDIRCHFGSNLQNTQIDQEKSSSNRRASTGVVLVTQVKSNFKQESFKTKPKTIFKRYVYRPKLTNDKSLEESIYQITDRSCQTSLELLQPYFDTEIKRKNCKNSETKSLMDEKEFNSDMVYLKNPFNNQRSSAKILTKIKKRDSNNNLMTSELRTASTQFNDKESDCDIQFGLKMNKEEESLENFKNLFIKNKNLILNWDYVQTSDYL